MESSINNKKESVQELIQDIKNNLKQKFLLIWILLIITLF